MKNSHKIYTILSVFALASLLVIMFLIWPALKEIQKSSNDFVLAKNSTVALKVQNSAIENFKENYNSYKSDLQKIDQLFIKPGDPVGFIEFLEKQALAYNVSSEISLPAYSNSPQQFIIVQVASSGSFSNILEFLKEVESGPYLVEIENLTIQNSKESARKAEAGFNIKVFTAL